MDDYRAHLIQNGVTVASCSGSRPEDVEREICHYAFIYQQDGPVRIKRNGALLRWLNDSKVE